MYVYVYVSIQFCYIMSLFVFFDLCDLYLRAFKVYREFHFDWFRETNRGMCCYMCWESDLFACEDFMKPFSQDIIAKTLSSNDIQKTACLTCI